MNAGTPRPVLYSIKHTTNKGLGVFATQEIHKGTRITCEHALLTVPREPGTIDPLAVYEAFEALKPQDQSTYLELSASQVQIDHALACIDDDVSDDIRNHIAKLGSIFECNAFNIGDEDEETGIVKAGIFPIAARFNHDCKPNVAQTWNENLQCLTIHAIRHIDKGEELCDSYVPLCQPSAARKEELRAYGFECECSVCGSPRAELRKSDEQRAMIRRLGEDLQFYANRRRGSWLGPISPSLVRGGQEDPLNVVRYIEYLLQDEGLEGHDLGQYYSFASWYCSTRSTGDLEESIEWQQKLFDFNNTIKGGDHEDTIRSKELLDNLLKQRSASYE
ncbi:uncharacterized protein PV09_02644 [Verruconis gallopava]|uniref:SET domain-containing protein n=1 Tax=Verruconis gallopava TaxID=253628 RepID=A0A0D1XW76_9PEZI|nr:uncharacterized protein PV09_02644 [Verruconis gallopava]KIW06986.1 hypothetical protein PV09_02644 [Verruconis gallopava]